MCNRVSGGAVTVGEGMTGAPSMTRASVLAATMARMNDEGAGVGEGVSLAFPRSELRQRTVRGALVNALFLGGADALVLAQGLIVTVLLGPRAIGLYGIVTTTAVTVAALRRIGIDEAFVQQREDNQEAEFSRAFTLELIVGSVFSLVLLIAAPIVALAYGDGELLWLTAAVAYLPTAFALQAPTWIFFRRMDFVRVRMLQALVPVVTFCVTVPLAALGVGVWSLVIGPAVGQRRGGDSRAGGLALPAPAELRRRGPDPLLPLLVAGVRGGGVGAARPTGADARVHAPRPAGGGRLYHAGGDADPVRRPRRPDHRDHDLPGHLRGP